VGDYDPQAHHMYFVHGDRMGTPLAATDVNDAINWQATYQPYGATQTLTQTGPTGAVLNNIRFPGQFFDHESGFQYNMNRDYLPGLGRYASEAVTIAQLLGGGYQSAPFFEGRVFLFDTRSLRIRKT